MNDDWRKEVTRFERRVYEVVRRIPKGQVRTYGWVARAIGQPNAARAVGQALKRNRWAPRIPCHRVTASNGSLGGYSAPGGSRRKRQLLRREGARWGAPRISERRLRILRVLRSHSAGRRGRQAC